MTQEEELQKRLKHLTDGLLEPYHYKELSAFISRYTAEKVLEGKIRVARKIELGGRTGAYEEADKLLSSLQAELAQLKEKK